MSYQRKRGPATHRMNCQAKVFLQVMYISKYQLNVSKIKAIAGILLSWEQLKWFCNNHYSFHVAQIEKLPIVQKFQWTFITRETNGWGRIQIPQHYGSLYCNPFLVILFVKKLMQQTDTISRHSFSCSFTWCNSFCWEC